MATDANERLERGGKRGTERRRQRPFDGSYSFFFSPSPILLAAFLRTSIFRSLFFFSTFFSGLRPSVIHIVSSGSWRRPPLKRTDGALPRWAWRLGNVHEWSTKLISAPPRRGSILYSVYSVLRTRTEHTPCTLITDYFVLCTAKKRKSTPMALTGMRLYQYLPAYGVDSNSSAGNQERVCEIVSEINSRRASRLHLPLPLPRISSNLQGVLRERLQACLPQQMVGSGYIQGGCHHHCARPLPCPPCRPNQ